MASSNSGVGKTVLITGGSGYVAAAILNAFLEHGYKVKTTVRNEASANKIKKSHSKYLDQLSFAIVKDVQVPGGHDEAVKGVDGVSSPHRVSPTSILTRVRSFIQPHLSSCMSRTMFAISLNRL
jgi:NAD(P)-dependent dehydrogenase (short-subunit alcohol dehydrogenase family)